MTRKLVEAKGKDSAGNCVSMILNFCRCGFVNYASVEEAKRVFDNPEDILVEGSALFINFAATSPNGMCIKIFSA